MVRRVGNVGAAVPHGFGAKVVVVVRFVLNAAFENKAEIVPKLGGMPDAFGHEVRQLVQPHKGERVKVVQGLVFVFGPQAKDNLFALIDRVASVLRRGRALGQFKGVKARLEPLRARVVGIEPMQQRDHLGQFEPHLCQHVGRFDRICGIAHQVHVLIHARLDQFNIIDIIPLYNHVETNNQDKHDHKFN